MPYSTNPVMDAADHDDRRYVADAELARAQEMMEAGFLRSCRAGDANALARWAPTVIDYDKPYVLGSSYRPRRIQTMSEAMRDALDYLDAETEMFQLVLNAANGADVKGAATDLVGRLARKFADQHAEAP